jgi:hypothetical protein
MTEIVVAKQNYVARYTGDVDPYKAFANEAGPMIQGTLLTCKKGLWEMGRDETPVPEGKLFLLIVPSMMRGMLKWMGGTVVDARIGLVKDNYLVPHRYTLGDLDEAAWEKGPDGVPRDPWTKSYLVQLIELSPPHGELTFSGGSYGARLTCQHICGVYSEQGPAQPDMYPVVTLGTKARATKSYGKILGPWFEVQGWATIEDVKSGRKAGTLRKVEAGLTRLIRGSMMR